MLRKVTRVRRRTFTVNSVSRERPENCRLPSGKGGKLKLRPLTALESSLLSKRLLSKRRSPCAPRFPFPTPSSLQLLFVLPAPGPDSVFAPPSTVPSA